MGLPVIRTGNVPLDRFLGQVREYIEHSQGGPGPQAQNRVLRVADIGPIVQLAAAGAAKISKGYTQGELEKFAQDLSNTHLFKSLMGPGSALGGSVAGIPPVSLSDVRAAGGRGAASANTTAFVAASDNRAVAAQVTTVQARLDNVGGATIEEAYLALADAQEGLLAQYTVKVTAGGAIAGFGLAATEKDGVPDSAFIIAANKFAIVSPGYAGGMQVSPPEANIPFGIDTVTNEIFLKGTVRIDAQPRSVRLTASDMSYNATTGTPGSITLTATRHGGLTGPLTFSTTAGTLSGSGDTRTLSMAGASTGAVVTVSVTEGGATYGDSLGIGRVANGTPGTPGTNGYNGSDGAPGRRGSTRAFRVVSGLSAWSDAEANAAISALGVGAVVLGDEVTLSNAVSSPTWSETKYWSAGGWTSVGVVIDGNLLVKGSVTSDAFAANSVWTRKLRVDASGWDSAAGLYKVLGGTSATVYAPVSVALAGASFPSRTYAGGAFSAAGSGTAAAIGVLGNVSHTGTVECAGVLGNGTGLGSYGGAFSGESADIVLYGSRRLLWGAVMCQEPSGGTANFLRADGLWAPPPAGGGSYTLTLAAINTAVNGGTIAGNISGNASSASNATHLVGYSGSTFVRTTGPAVPGSGRPVQGYINVGGGVALAYYTPNP